MDNKRPKRRKDKYNPYTYIQKRESTISHLQMLIIVFKKF